ncbi:hypothetical protein CHU98_g7622 [Xylaria longipes]|nr:hypothetical protein CHU98_g7622 [Xylaria longipes]
MSDDGQSHEGRQGQIYEDAQDPREQPRTSSIDTPYEFTAEEIAEHTSIPLTSVQRTINPQAYNNTLRNPRTASRKKINAWAAYLYTKYSQSKYKPRDLQETLADDFELAGLQTLQSINSEIIGKIYNTLRTKGILNQEPVARLKKNRIAQLAQGRFILSYQPQIPTRQSQTLPTSPTPSQQLLNQNSPVRRNSPAILTPETRAQSQEDPRTQGRERPLTQDNMLPYDNKQPRAHFQETLPSIKHYPSLAPTHNPAVRSGSMPHFQRTEEYPVLQYPPQTPRQPMFRTTPNIRTPTSRIQIPPTHNMQNGIIPSAKYQSRSYMEKDTNITFVQICKQEKDLSPYEALEVIIDKLSKAQRALGAEYSGKIHLSTTIARACKGIPEFKTTLIFQKPTCEGFFSNLRSCLRVKGNFPNKHFVQEAKNTYYTDRRYNQTKRYPARYKNAGQYPRYPQKQYPSQNRAKNLKDRTDNPHKNPRTNKQCFVCQKEGCWSTNHTPHKRARAKSQYFNTYEIIFHDKPTPEEFSTYLTKYEGYLDMYEEKEEEDSNTGDESVAQYLINNTFIHRTTQEDIWTTTTDQPSDQFVLNNQYPKVSFGGGRTTISVGTIKVNNKISRTTFHMLNTPTPFLFSLADTDRLGAYFNNTRDVIIRKDKRTIPVEALCKCWINVYQGPPDNIVHNPGTNFSSDEFRKYAIGKVERAHGPLRRAYDILRKEIDVRTDNELILQMAIKALNDTAGPNGLVPTLLVFGAYPRINEDSPPSPALVKPYYRTKDAQTEGIENNDVQQVQPAVTRRKRGRLRKEPTTYLLYNAKILQMFLTLKEQQAFDLATKLRTDGVITTSGKPFKESDATEINELIARGVFEFVAYDPDIHGKKHIFKSRLVQEVKRKNTKPYEKSRLVVQGYNDAEKDTILTQSPTIQRISQRLILALGPSLVQDFGALCELKDITQAYVQSEDKLSRDIYARLPPKLKNKYPPGTILWIVQPLYSLAESGLYWFKTYHQHHREKLKMQVSTFATPKFSVREEEELQQAKLRTKPKETLSPNHPIEFNGGKISTYGHNITMTQKGQAKDLAEIDPRTKSFAQAYVSQRARGAYISSICQPEAAYNLAVAAQVTKPQSDNVKALNKRIKWQKDNPSRGLTFIPLDLYRTKLFIFINGSFANNIDMTSQLGFVIILAVETRTKDSTNLDFEIKSNIVHWNSSKYKRVTRSVLASELYGMVSGFDSTIALRTTIQKVMEALNLPPIPAVLCSDSKSLYDCLVKLGTTQEKRLMIDIMSLRESYKKKEISKVQWINSKNNPADAFTKHTSSARTSLESRNPTTTHKRRPGIISAAASRTVRARRGNYPPALDQDGPEVPLATDELRLNIGKVVGTQHLKQNVLKNTTNHSHEKKDKTYTYIHAKSLHEFPTGPTTGRKTVDFCTTIILQAKEVPEPRHATQGGRRRARADGSSGGSNSSHSITITNVAAAV